MKYSTLLSGCILALCCLQAAAEIHRCTGKDGTVQFTDTPCGETATSFRSLKPANRPAGVPHNEKRDRLLRAFDVERRQAQQQAAEEKATRAERDMKCKHARDQLRLVNRAGRIYNADADGNRVVQSDEAYAETVRQAEDYVAHWCD
jgi:hypothetical protein